MLARMLAVALFQTLLPAQPARLSCPRLGLRVAFALALAFGAAASPSRVLAADSRALPLRVMVSESWGMPFGQLQRQGSGQQLSAGIAYDWYLALAHELERPLEQRVRSRRRQEASLLAHEVDVFCLVRPDWLSKEVSAALQWASQPVMTAEDRIVAAPGVPVPTSLDDLRGQTLGTVLGFVYPSLEAHFAAGHLRREDAPNETALTAKLLRAHNRYGVLKTLDARYQQRSQPAAKALGISAIVVANAPLFCALAPQARISLAELEAAQASLLRRGEMARILAKY